MREFSFGSTARRNSDSSRADFIFTVPEILAEIMTYLPLEPGGVILTGTPGESARSPTATTLRLR